MSEADGEVRIKVNLDLDEVDKDIERLQKTLKEQTASLQKQESAVDKLRGKYDKLAQSLAQKIETKEVELGVNKIKEKIAELTDFKEQLNLVPRPDTKAIANTEKQIAVLQNTLSEMKKKAVNDEAFSGLKNSMSELKKEIDLATQSQEALREKVAQTKKALERLENQKLEGTQGAFNKIKNSLNSAKNSLENLKNLMGKTGSSDAAKGAFDGLKEGIRSSQSEAQGLSGKIGDVFGNLGRKVEGFGSRIFRLASSAFVFNVISSGFREMARGIQSVIAQDSALSASLSMVSSNLFTAFYPIYQAILPALRALGQGLAWVTGQIAAFIAMLTGTSVRANQIGAQMMAPQFGDSGKISKSAKALGDQAKGYDKIGKAAQKAKGELASFDKIEVLRQNHEKAQKTPKASSGSGSGGAGGTGAGFAAGFNAQTPKLLDSVAAAFERLKKPFENMDLTAITAQFGRLWEVLSRFAGKIGEGLWWFYENVLAPLAVWTISEVLPAFLRILNAVLEAIEPILDTVGQDLIMLYDKFFKPAAEWTGKKIIDGLNGIADALDKIGDWIRDNNWFVEGLSAILIGIAGALALVKIGTIAMNASLWLMSGGLTSVIAKTWAWTAALLANPWTWVVAGIAAIIAAIVLCVKHWDELKEGAINCFRKITEVLDKIAPGWRGALNVVIGIFEGFVNTIIDGINLLTWALNKVGFDIPDFLGGGHFGINIPQVSHVSIPRLAKGAVLEGGNPFLAWVNDQPRGQTNIETPLSTMVEAFKSAMGSNQKQDIVIEANGDFSQFIRFLNFKLKQEDARIGQSLITGDAWV